MQKLKYIFVVAVLLYISGCGENNTGDKFDRAAMLTNLGNNIIVPGFQQLGSAAAQLKLKKDAFTGNPSLATLDSFKAAFVIAYLAYIEVEVYNLSPSEGLRNFNAFPGDSVQIKSNISTLSYDLNTANNLHAKGFPALDYLFYNSSSADIVNAFTSDALADNRKHYLNEIVNELSTKCDEASTGWSNYLNQFVGASGTDLGSSVSMLVNDLAFEVERDRRERVGVPLGYVGFVNSGTQVPEVVEAKYSLYSKQLLIKNLQACKQLYTGGTGKGFDDYLDYLGAEVDAQPLSSTITAQFDITIQKAQNVPVDFATALTSNNTEMESLFLELKKLVVLLKVDMSSQIGVVINYSDNDGD